MDGGSAPTYIADGVTGNLTQVQPLDSNVWHPEVELNGLNVNGWAVGWSGSGMGYGSHALLKKPKTGSIDLGTLPGHNFSKAYAISDKGTVVGASGDDNDFQSTFHAFIYRGGVMSDLGTLEADGMSQANAVNISGVAAGAATVTVPGSWQWHAFVTRKSNGTGMHDVNELLDAPRTFGTYIAEIRAINNADQMVGRTQDGHGVLLTRVQ